MSTLLKQLELEKITLWEVQKSRKQYKKLIVERNKKTYKKRSPIIRTRRKNKKIKKHNKLFTLATFC